MSMDGENTRKALKDYKFAEVPDSELDYEIDSPNKFFGSHVNLIPLQNAVAGARLFYGARFANQAMPLVHREAPLVQNLVDGDPQGRSFDEYYGEKMGAIRSPVEGIVHSVSPDEVVLAHPETGQKHKVSLYNNMPLNRKTSIHSTTVVQPGQHVAPGDLLASSNYTDQHGTLAVGRNARVGLVPYKGFSMDDAIAISESMAKSLTQEAMFEHSLDYKRGVKGGKHRYMGLFPKQFVNDQLEKLDDEGVVHVGQTVNHGDPLILATRPKVISSTNSQVSKLSSHMKNAQSDASLTWDSAEPGIVTDVKKLRSGARVNVKVQQPTELGDKLTFRPGQKSIVSLIIPDEHMPRTLDGKPLEVLLNPLGLPSRVNNNLVYEILLGKIAAKTGQPYKIPGFNKQGEKWYDFTEQELKKHGLSPTEELFDPMSHRKLENPVTVGHAYISKLHHTSDSKLSVRGQGSYDNAEQPARGGSEHAQAKKVGNLETAALLSSGAYNVLKESATLRGQKNDEYWKALREGREPARPGSPFVWDKFHALLNGSGYLGRKLPGGKERLTFYTDKDLDKANPIEVKTGDIVDLDSLAPIKGGLFDDAIVGGNSWGRIPLPFPVVNPATETMVRKLLGLTEKQFRDIMAGKEKMPEHLLAGEDQHRKHHAKKL